MAQADTQSKVLPPPPLVPPRGFSIPGLTTAPGDYLPADVKARGSQVLANLLNAPVAGGVLRGLGAIGDFATQQMEQGAFGAPEYRARAARARGDTAGAFSEYYNAAIGAVGGLENRGARAAGGIIKGAVGSDQSAIAAKLASAEKAPLTKLTGRAATDAADAAAGRIPKTDVSIAPAPAERSFAQFTGKPDLSRGTLVEPPARFTVEPGKTVSFVRDTKTGEKLPTIFAGPKHLENAAADAARRSAIESTSASAKTVAAAVASETNPLRRLSTAQLGALHGVTQNPADKQVIEALLGERAFSVAPAEKIAVAVNLVDRNVATEVRRAIRGVPDASLSNVESAVDDAIAAAKLEKTPANRSAVLQGLMDQQAANNVRNAGVNAARGGTPPPVVPPSDLPPPPPEARGLGREIYESLRSLKSFIDVAIGRQGIRAVGNPVAFAKGAVAAAKGYKTGPKIVTQWLDAKKADPMWDTIVGKMKVELTSAESGSVVGKLGREEMFPGGAIEQAPVLGGAIQHSNAAFTHGLNVTRWEKAVGDLKQAEFLWKNLLRQAGPLPDSELAGLGRNVNVATGRGQLGSFTGVGHELGSAFFSPRNTISWPQFFTDWALHLKNGNKVAAVLQAKTLVTFLGFSIGALKAHEMVTGTPTQTDPRSSDFLKVIDGDQRLDIMGGGQQWMVALARIATGQTKSLAGNTAATTPSDVLGSFILNRTHPALGTIGDAANLAMTAVQQGQAGKPLTGTAKDSQGVEFGVLETLLGAVAPIVAQGFLDSIRFEMAHDKNYMDAALHTVPQLLGFGGGEYRAGYKQEPFFAPEKPVTPDQIVLSGRLQVQQNEAVAAAKKTALDQLAASTQFQALPPASQKTLSDKLSNNVGDAANKAFGLNLALNGSPDESKQGALIAFKATPKSYDRGQLLTIMQSAGRLSPEAVAAIDAKRDQTDPAKPNYDMSVDDYIHGAQLVNQHAAAPEFTFGTPNEWASAARAADLLRKMVADDNRLGKKPSEDTHITEFYFASPGLVNFYEKDGSRRTKFVSPQRLAIEQDLLWDRFASAARDKEAK